MADANLHSLTDVVKQVAQRQQSQTSEIEKSKELLLQFQNHFNDLESQRKLILVETRKTEKELHQREDEIETTDLNCERLVTQNQSLYAENVKLKLKIELQKEDFEALLKRNNKYREKIALHKELFSEAENKLPIMVELFEKKDAVERLKMRKEELIRDLENPEGNAIKQLQGEIADIKKKMTAIKELIIAKTIVLEKEKQMHMKCRKEIEVQNKRYEAILKRLHCQLNKAQLSKRQRKWDIEQMEKTRAEMKKCLGMTE